MDLDEDISTSPVSSLLENEIPFLLDDCVQARSYIGLVGSVSGIGAEMIYSNLNYTIPGKGKKEAKQIIKNCRQGFILFVFSNNIVSCVNHFTVVSCFRFLVLEK